MKFSVLLPTRDRLEYLRYAVETVRRQDYSDWEIVVSDNASTDDVAGFVRALRDPRIKYVRTSRFVPVTDNWNHALAHSSGDFTIMLGDDDGLMPGYFQRASRLISQYETPDLIYGSSYLYAYPGVLPAHPEGLLHHYHNAHFMRTARAPFVLPRQMAIRLVRESVNFKMKFTYNMQYSLISNRLLATVTTAGPLFQSPFPDFYASNVLFLKAERILIDPTPMVAIGITPRSYGFYLFNNREDEGVEFLGGGPVKHGTSNGPNRLLPGTNMNSSWLLAMDAVVSNYGARYRLEVNYRRYRRLQIVHVLRARIDGRVSEGVHIALKEAMSPLERLLFGGGLIFVSLAVKVLRGRPRALFRRTVRWFESWHRASTEWKPADQLNAYQNMLEVFQGLELGHVPADSGRETV